MRKIDQKEDIKLLKQISKARKADLRGAPRPGFRGQNPSAAGNGEGKDLKASGGPCSGGVRFHKDAARALDFFVSLCYDMGISKIGREVPADPRGLFDRNPRRMPPEPLCAGLSRRKLAGLLSNGSP